MLSRSSWTDQVPRGWVSLTGRIFLILGLLLLTRPLGTWSGEIVTVQSVELKTSDNRWITVIEPDKQVDLTQEEPLVNFINNGRIPPGFYKNFKVVFDVSGIEREKIYFSSFEDWMKPVEVKKTSFIAVRFGLNLEDPKDVRWTRVTVDADTRILQRTDLVFESIKL